MLWDPSKDKKPAVENIDALIAWLETKPGGERYCYLEGGRCLLAQYLMHCGYKNPLVGGHDCVQMGP